MSKVANYEPPPPPTYMAIDANAQQPAAAAHGLLPNQPTLPVRWMKPEPPSALCPSGLEALLSLEKILVNQEINQADELVGQVGNFNRYKISNQKGEQVYSAVENPTVDTETSNNRAFVIQFFDSNNREVMRVLRSSAGICSGCCCCICCCSSCAHEATIESPPGQVIGSIKQAASCLSIKFHVFDAEGNTVLDIIPPNVYYPESQVDFNLVSPIDDTTIGEINKFDAGEEQEQNTIADNFGLTVPIDTPVKLKATLLGAILLIDFLYFEEAPVTIHFGHSRSHGHRRRGKSKIKRRRAARRRRGRR